jgi:class 3 adenylate cyclase
VNGEPSQPPNTSGVATITGIRHVTVGPTNAVTASQKVCGEAALAHDGHVAQYLGDGVVMYFGYPRSHEDQAHRAIRCGFDILKGLEAVRASVRMPAGISLEVRLGAHTGRVVVGPLGVGNRRVQIALGDTPNIAARVQAEAGPACWS